MRPNQHPRARTAIAVAIGAIVVGGLTIAVPAAAHDYDRTGHDRAGYDRTGTASWYGKRYHGRTTASGERFDMNAMTAAHRSLPFGTRVRVTNMANRRSMVLTINDRGPYAGGRIIDVSRRAAAILGMMRKGVVRVRVRTVAAR